MFKKLMARFDGQLVIIIAVFVVILGVLLFSLIYENTEWTSFKQAHHCKKTAEIKGELFNTIGLDGNGNLTVGIGSTSDKIGWLCDDGITYYR